MKKELVLVLTSVPVGADIFIFLRGLLEGGERGQFYNFRMKSFFLIVPFNPTEGCELGHRETRAVVL